MKYGKWGYLDYQGNVVIKPQYADADSFSNGLAAVKVDMKRGFIDNKNNMVIQPQFGEPNGYIPANYYKFDENGFAPIPNEHGSVINRKGEKITPPRWDPDVVFYDDCIVVFHTGGVKNEIYRIEGSGGVQEVTKEPQAAQPKGVTQNSSKVNMKNHYLRIMDSEDKELSDIAKHLQGASMQNQIMAAEELCSRWDYLMNDIYENLKEGLPPGEAGNLEKKQEEWIKYRDDTAQAASSKYAGGIMEDLEYKNTLARITKERCYELVETYMN